MNAAPRVSWGFPIATRSPDSSIAAEVIDCEGCKFDGRNFRVTNTAVSEAVKLIIRARVVSKVNATSLEPLVFQAAMPPESIFG